MIRFSNVTFTHAEATAPVLSGVDLTIPEGDLALVIGRTGSGKSTLLNMINGLVAKVAKEELNMEVKLPLPRMTYDEAMERFGHDAPDLRFGLEIVDCTDLAAESEFRVFRSVAEAGNRGGALAATGRLSGVHPFGWDGRAGRDLDDQTGVEDAVALRVHVGQFQRVERHLEPGGHGERHVTRLHRVLRDLGGDGARGLAAGHRGSGGRALRRRQRGEVGGAHLLDARGRGALCFAARRKEASSRKHEGRGQNEEPWTGGHAGKCRTRVY